MKIIKKMIFMPISITPIIITKMKIKISSKKNLIIIKEAKEVQEVQEVKVV